MIGNRFSVAGRTALVTGGAQGIGLAISQVLTEAGARVVIADLDRRAAQNAAAGLQGGMAEALDVTNFDACAALAARLVPDILIANAGIVHNAPMTQLDPEDWRRVIDVNLSGVFHTMRAFGPGMVARGSGSIVAISSMCGDLVVVPQPQVAYNAAKAGVNLIVKSAAVEWAQQGVRVNAVAPGYTATKLTLAGRSRPDWFQTWTERTPMGRLGEPCEIADAVLFLASDAASFITGTVMNVDGGYSAV